MTNVTHEFLSMYLFITLYMFRAPRAHQNGYRVSSPGVMLPARGVNHPPTPGVEVKETVELYYAPPLRPYMACYKENFPFLLDSMK
jgi:hypothetical protein